ncbi:MAG TPA: SBBP repeat-containing protein [Bryobacteraceae bacterium]|nr:SBBP repeat-containing protein [Bryobacteraceae bacterium]
MLRHLPILAGLAGLFFAAIGNCEAIEVPLFFYERKPDSNVYMARTPYLTAYLDENGLALEASGIHLHLEFLGSSAGKTLGPETKLNASVNILLGKPETWRTDLPAFARIRYKGVYPGIDAVYGGTERKLKSEFVVAPGSDPHVIQLRYRGAEQIHVAADGALVVTTASGEFREDAPVIYQLIRGHRKIIQGGYRVSADQIVSFAIDPYDRKKELIIDPVLTYSSYVGGRGIDAGTGIATDAAGNVYVCGYTESPDFPIAGAIQGRVRGVDAFVMKLNSAGDTLLYATYLGGSAYDAANGITVDANGSAIVAGRTGSSDFPTVSAFQPVFGGGMDGFVAKLSPLGNTIVYSTYLGGAASDAANAVALDTVGNAYITGDTSSANFPTRAGFQSINRGRSDAFGLKLNTAGSIQYSTYLGGMGDESGKSIAVDTAGAAYIAGNTTSPDFPVLNAFQPNSGGGEDAFVTKLSPTGSALVYSTYLGGSSGSVTYPESANGIAVDSQGAAVVVGSTNSSNFPLQAPIQPLPGGTLDAFVTKLTPTGSALIYSTYLGGVGLDYANAVTLDASGQAYVTGGTNSINFPAVNPLQPQVAGLYDIFVTKFDAAGTRLVFSTLLGGSGSEEGLGIARTNASEVWTTGMTTSGDLQLVGALQTFGGAEGSVLLARIADAVPATSSVSPASGYGASQAFQFTLSDQNGPANIVSATMLVNSSLDGNNACYVVFYANPNSAALWSDATAGWLPVVFGSGAVVQNNQCSLSGAGSSVSGSGANLVVTLALTFKRTFAGTKNVYAQVTNRSGLSSGWELKGTWTIPPNQAPAAIVSPSGGQGRIQSFQFTLSDPDGAADIASATMLVSPTLDGNNACYIVFYASSNSAALWSDTLPGWLPFAFGAAASVSNGQCSISASASSAVLSGTALVVSLALTFKSSFSGTKNVYVQVRDQGGLSSGWQLKGMWTVPADQPPSVVVSPASGSGRGQTFQFAFSDVSGPAAVDRATMLFSPALDGNNACYLLFYAGSGTAALWSDASAGWLFLQLGSATVVQNGQCAISGAESSATVAGGNLVLSLAITFKLVFSGTKNIYAQVTNQSGMSAGWQLKGSWTVPANQPPSVTVFPAAGSGRAQNFQFRITDPDGVSEIRSATMLVSPALDGNNACYLVFYAGSATAALWSDAAAGWLPFTPGSNTVVENGQCSISGAASSVTASSSDLVVSFAITFKASFVGSKNVYVQASDATSSSGWQWKGIWTVI